MAATAPDNRPMTREEQHLVRWMLENGDPTAKSLLPQLASARVTPWRCVCGCASFNVIVEGSAAPTGPITPVADFLFGDRANLSGIFVFEQCGVLGGVEVYGLAGDAPKTLPAPENLRSFKTGMTPA